YFSQLRICFMLYNRVGGLRGPLMRSSIVKRSIVIGGHKTSVSLEDAFWTGLKHVARVQRVTLSELISKIDSTRQQSNLSSALRLFVLNHFRSLFLLHKVRREDDLLSAAKAHPSPIGAERTPTGSP